MKRSSAWASFASVVAGATMVAGGCSSASSPADGGPGAALERATGTAWIVDTDPSTGAVSFAAPKAGGVPLASARSVDEAVLAFLDVHKSIFEMHDPRTELRLARIDRAEDGTSHVRFEQTSRGVVVAGSAWTAHVDASGRLTSMSGHYVLDAFAVETTAHLVPELATATAKAEALKRYPAVDPNVLTTTEPVLRIVPAPEGSALAWEVGVNGERGALVALSIHVDAKSGVVLRASDRLRSVRATGAAPQTYPPYNQQAAPLSFLVSADNPPMLLATTSSGARITVGSLLEPEQRFVTATSTSPWADATTPPGHAIAAMAHMEIVLDYFAAHRWGADASPYVGLDGRGKIARAFINAQVVDPQAAQNAYWNGSNFYFGDGATWVHMWPEEASRVDPSRLVWPMAGSLDAVAHELTHAVSEFTAGLLAVTGEESAINESMSDVFAALVTHRVRNDDAAAFTIAEDTNNAHAPARSMVAPVDREGMTASGTSNSHAQSALASHAFYLLTHGGTQPTTGTKVPCGIGWAAADRLYWRLETSYLHAGETFRVLALDSLVAAKELGIPPMPVACAWVAVGVLQDEEAKSEFGITCEHDGRDAGEAASDASDNLLVSGPPVALVECSVSLLGDGVSLGER